MSGRSPLPISGVSVAGVETAIEVPSFRLVLDMGRCLPSAVNQPLVLVSHGHLDHSGALPQHAARRAMMRMPEPTYVVPTEARAAAEELFNWAGALDGHAIPRRIVALEPGQELALSATRFVRPFATMHRVPSQGYTVWERRNKLKPEFRGTSGVELARLRATGVAIEQPIEVPLLSFSGDTRADVLETVPELGRVETLILETSFLDARVSVADARVMGHVHLDEVLARQALLPPGDLVFSHFSARYEADEVTRILAARLPPELAGRVRILR